MVASILVRNLQPLAKCPSLRVLDVSDCPLVDDASIGAFDNFAGLERVALSRCSAVTSLGFLRSSRSLRRLNIGGTSVTSLDPLRPHRFLTHLDVSKCPVSSLEPLAGMASLQNLSIANTLVQHASVLLTCPSLALLDVRECPSWECVRTLLAAAQGKLIVLSSRTCQ